MFSFDATPMTPIGTESIIHIKPARCQPWGYHAIKAWYWAPALNHYRCIKAMIESGAIWVTDMFKFHHHSLPFPTVSNADCIIKAVQDLKCAIDSKPTAPHDGLQDIEALHVLILACNNTNDNATSDRTRNRIQ
jgi:hypothetical protein